MIPMLIFLNQQNLLFSRHYSIDILFVYYLTMHEAMNHVNYVLA